MPDKHRNIELISKNGDLSLKSTRRGFLKFVGFSTAALVLASACRKKPIKALMSKIPVLQNSRFTSKKWYTSTCQGCAAGCPMIVKVTRNRPVKLEGNLKSSMTNGGLCAYGQASIYQLYSDHRFRGPMKNGQAVSWETLDAAVLQQLERIKGRDGRIILLSSTIHSPSTLQVIRDFSEHFQNVEHIQYDPISSYSIIKASERCFGKKILPVYHFDKARTIVSFGADFLGTWISPVEYSAAYVTGRDIDAKREMSWHVQVESALTLTGMKADRRIAIKPSKEGLFLVELYNKIAYKTGKQELPAGNDKMFIDETGEIADRLFEDRGRSLVIGNSNVVSHQMILNGINSLLGNFGRTIDLDNVSFQKNGDDGAFDDLVRQMIDGKIESIIFYGIDPVRFLPDPTHFIEALKKVSLSVSFSPFSFEKSTELLNETAGYVNYICPDQDPLESWNDFNPKTGFYSISQPMLSPLHDVRQVQQSLLKWSGGKMDYYDYIREYWKKNLFDKQTKHPDFESFWNHLLNEGVHLTAISEPELYNFSLYLKPEAKSILEEENKDGAAELILYESMVHREGRLPENPVLLELPDPVTKICWENCASVSPAFLNKRQNAKNKLLHFGDQDKNDLFYKTRIEAGLHEDVVAIPLANLNGTLNLSKKEQTNSFNLIKNGKYSYFPELYFKKHSDSILPAAQSLIPLKTPPALPEFTVNEFLKMSSPLDDSPDRFYSRKKKFYPHHWAMIIDLNLCTGCSSCAVSCMIENNVPATGPGQIRKRREMHWLRIEKYEIGGTEKDIKFGIVPVLCQHCNNAPCEAVCPVAATSSSNEGINQQVYQRCIGTRFCESNCPYQVRRFNYYDYYGEPDFIQLNSVRKEFNNPDVSLRNKGVMEKCSFCIQRIEEAKNQAKTNNSILADGEIKTACSQSCPTQAIIFGDLNDKSSRVYSLLKSKRVARLLDENGTMPFVFYLTRIRNNNKKSMI